MARAVVSFEEFEKWAKNNGFNDIDISKINKRRNHYHMSYKVIMDRFDDAKKELEKLGLSSRNAMLILILNPMLVYVKHNYETRYEVFKKYAMLNDKEKINITAISSLLKYKEEKIDGVIKVLKKHKIDDEEIRKILAINHRFFTAQSEIIDNKLTFIENLDISTKKIIEVLKLHAGGIFKLDSKYLSKRYDKLISYGFKNIMWLFKQNANILVMNDKQLDEVLKYWTSLIGKEKTVELLNKKPYYFNISFYSVNKLKNSLKEYGFNDVEINIILVKAAETVIKCYNPVSKITKAFEDMEFTKNEVKRIILDDPKLLYKAVDTLKKSYDIILNSGYTKEEAKKVVLEYPRIFESNTESLNEKLDLINKLDIKDIILLNPKNLIQGNEKTYLRYMYAFNVLEEELGTKNYTLLYSPKLKRVPDIEVLKTMYSYEDDKNNSLDNRLKRAKENNIKVKCIN